MTQEEYQLFDSIRKEIKRLADILESVTSDNGYILVKDVNHE